MMDAMFWIVLSTLAALVLLVALVLQAHSREVALRHEESARAARERMQERREWRDHTERLERIVAARNVSEAAAVERVYASPPSGEERPEREPDEIDQLYADPPRRQARGE